MLPTLLLSLLLGQAPASGGDSANHINEPYQLLVVLQFADDPLFTRLFRTSVARQARDQLTNYFGALAKVQVQEDHPLLEKLDATGLQTLSLTPADFATLQLPDKVFIVSVGNVDGAYRLEWRQLDAQTQQIGPWHWRSTPDRQWVGKAVCMCVKEDFAPVAVVKPIAAIAGVDTRQVELEFRGGKHAELLSRWLGPNCVLQPYWVQKQKDGSLKRVPIPNTVLRIDKTGGPRRATVVSNQPDPWKPNARVVGFEALKLNTQDGRLRLRLVDSATGDPVRAQVYANTVGFGSLDSEHQLPLPDREGYVVSREPISHLAFVRITQGGSSFVQFPLPITSDWCEMTCKVPLDKAAGQKSEFDRLLRYLVQDVGALQAALNDNVRRTNQLHTDKKYEEELRLLKQALASAVSNRQDAGKAQNELKAKAADLNLKGNPMLALVDGQLQQIDGQVVALTKKVGNVDNLIQNMNAQARAQVLVGLGEEAEAAGEIEEALEKYELALGEQPNQPMLKARLESLKETWRIKSPEHQKARTFVFERWPVAEVTEVGPKLAEAEKAFATLKEVGDTLTAKKLSSVNDGHVTAISELIGQIASDEQADVAEVEKYEALLNKLAEFQARINEFGASAQESTNDGGQAPPPKPAKRPPPEEEETPPKKNP